MCAAAVVCMLPGIKTGLADYRLTTEKPMLPITCDGGSRQVGSDAAVCIRLVYYLASFGFHYSCRAIAAVE